MKYSILMTVYKNDNRDYFREALLSVVDQTLKADEIVIVKDGPITEELQKVIDQVSSENLNLIKEVQLEKNVGLGLALNRGIDNCSNELIARMDADDISMKYRCQRLVEAFERNPDLDIVGSPVIEFIDDITNVVGQRNVPLNNEDIHKFNRTRDPFNHPAVMYRKSKVLDAGMYSDLRKNQDTDLWIKMLSRGAICANVAEPLLYFRFDKNTYKKRKNWTNTKLLIGIRWKAYKNGYCSFLDFLKVAGMQTCIYIMPSKFQELVYKKLLRR